MAITHLLDTNILIYAMRNQIPASGLAILQQFRDSGDAAISIITEIEVLGFFNGTAADFAVSQRLIATMQVLSLDEVTKDLTIQLRRKYRIKLPDAVIAATAIRQNVTLVSRNDKDFLRITELQYKNPFPII
ncbi:type II toxin-antitoxin system VapC family toxin [Lewinella sp. 4G2]|uniref:type II toxin-antitoxin system VapC family toxin n=1 Tax=Lewinella sp. 4G2 TaxID=1803372 RepID=UPI0007E0FE0F|nr:type II toxin-antitoxin system VapC family toxin [Lewinella sp. 4G2]OAV44087.1 hypothetical protein A3850_006055 [Lewinella sp. 4G2]